jgi:hypothetical protein
MARTDDTAPAEVEQRGRRMTLSQVVERLLERGGNQHSSVDLGLTASGKVTIAVSVRTTPDGEAPTLDAAAELAQSLFDTLRLKYEPTAAPAEGGEA